MNILKVQQEILKAVCANPENVKHYTLASSAEEEGRLFLTVDGKVGYVVPVEGMHVILRGSQIMADLGP